MQASDYVLLPLTFFDAVNTKGKFASRANESEVAGRESSLVALLQFTHPDICAMNASLSISEPPVVIKDFAIRAIGKFDRGNSFSKEIRLRLFEVEILLANATWDKLEAFVPS